MGILCLPTYQHYSDPKRFLNSSTGEHWELILATYLFFTINVTTFSVSFFAKQSCKYLSAKGNSLSKVQQIHKLENKMNTCVPFFPFFSSLFFLARDAFWEMQISLLGFLHVPNDKGRQIAGVDIWEKRGRQIFWCRFEIFGVFNGMEKLLFDEIASMWSSVFYRLMC